MDPIQPTLDEVRIRKIDPKNFVIEYLAKSLKPGKPRSWQNYGYYGKPIDLAKGLAQLLVEIPEGDTLKEQLEKMTFEIRRLEVLLIQNIDKFIH